MNLAIEQLRELQLAYNRTQIEEIYRRAHIKKIDVLNQRDEDISHRVNDFRREHLYYPSAREYQKELDKIFSHRLPWEFIRMKKYYGDTDQAWNETEVIAKEVKSLLKGHASELGGGIIDCRAKSLLSCFDKVTYNGFPLWAAFDRKGIRLMVPTKERARNVSSFLLSNYYPLDTYLDPSLKDFPPIHDTLDSPNNNGYSHIRMDLHHKTGVFEVIIETLEGYNKWGHHELMKEEFGSGDRKGGIIFE